MIDPGVPDLDPPALAKLLEQREEFRAFLERRVGDRNAAEDLLQEAFAKAIERLDSVRDEEVVVAWFYRVLRNSVIDQSRRKGAADRRLSAYAESLRPGQPDEAHATQICECVGALVDTLKPEYSAALREVDLGGRSVKSFADDAGITPNNAGVRLHRARKALRRQTLAFCRLCAEHGCVDCSCQAGAHGQPDRKDERPR